MASLRTYLVLEGALRRRLHAAWEAHAGRVVREVNRLASREDTQDALDALKALDLGAAVEEVAGYAEFVGVSAIAFGAGNLAGAEVKEPAAGTDLVGSAVDAMMEGFRRGTDGLRARASRGVQALQERRSDVARKADAALADFLNDQVMNGGRALLDVGANLTTSRLASFGFLAEAEDRGIATYQVSEVLDDLTCPVCVRMHGRTFEVRQASMRLQGLLQERDPDALRTLAPFHPQDKRSVQRLHDASDADLQARGYDAPPYHPSCRGQLVRQGTARRASVPRPALQRDLPEGEAPLVPLADARDTQAMWRAEGGSWLPARRRLHDDILDDLTRDVPVQSAGRREVLVMGGGTAAGKSSVLRAGKVKAPKGALVVDPDEIKQRLPEYQRKPASQAAAFTHEESSHIAARLGERGRERGFNVVLDGTGDSGIEKLTGRLAPFREKGYRVRAFYATVPTEEALRREAARAAQTGRKAPEDVVRGKHASVTRDFQEALRRSAVSTAARRRGDASAAPLFDEAELWDTFDGGTTTRVARWSADDFDLQIENERLWHLFRGKDQPGGLVPWGRARPAMMRTRSAGTASYRPVEKRLTPYPRRPELGSREVQAVTVYQSSAYAPINRSLRSGEVPEVGDFRVQHMDDAIAKSRVPDADVELWRGVRYNDWQVGSTVVDRGYGSFSFDRRVALEAFGGRDDTLLRVRLPANRSAAYVDEIEHEVVLPRDTRYRVVSDEPDVTVDILEPLGLPPREVRARVVTLEILEEGD